MLDPSEIKPHDIVVFGGKIDLRRLRKNERLIVKAAQVQKGDFRNWHAIETWVQQIADVLKTVAIDTLHDEAYLPTKD
jgi:menaquinone-dependent protoporphyrinogen IX oxidase